MCLVDCNNANYKVGFGVCYFYLVFFLKQIHHLTDLTYIKNGDIYNGTLQLRLVSLNVLTVIGLSWMDPRPDLSPLLAG